MFLRNCCKPICAFFLYRIYDKTVLANPLFFFFSVIADPYASIMLSGVVNAYWPPALLAISLAPHIEDMSLVPALEAVNPIVTLLKGELLSALFPGISENPNAVPSIASFNTMIASRLTVLAITTDEHSENLAFIVLRLMQHLALLVEHNNTHMAPNFFSIWRFVLQDILAGPP